MHLFCLQKLLLTSELHAHKLEICKNWNPSIRRCLHVYFHIDVKFTPAWVHFCLLRKPLACNRLHFNTQVKSHAAVLFSRPSFRANWNFASRIFVHDSYVWTIFFSHSGLKSEFFMQNWHHKKLHRSEFYCFVNYEIIKQITKEKMNERWLLED